MKSMKWSVLFVFAAMFVAAGCPDDDCTDCSCDPSLCDGSADADADADGDVPTTTGHLRVTSVPVAAEGVEIDGASDPRCPTTPCELDLPVGLHRIHLSAAGRLHLPDPVEVDLPPTGADVNIFLGWNLAGSWRTETGSVDDGWEMMTWEPDAYCPDGGLQVRGVTFEGRFCLEPDDTISLCKTRASPCEGFVTGRILENGTRVEWRGCRIDNPSACVDHVFTKM